MINKLKTIVLITCINIGLAASLNQTASAKDFYRDFTIQADMDACVNAILNVVRNDPVTPNIRYFNRGALALLETHPMCRFKQSDQIEKLDDYIKILEHPLPKIDVNTLMEKMSGMETLLISLNNDFSKVAENQVVRWKDMRLPSRYSTYANAVQTMAPKVTLSTLTSNYKGYANISANASLFELAAYDNSSSPDTPHPYNFKMAGSANLSNCEKECKAYIETIIFARLWYKLWTVNSTKILNITFATLQHVDKEYDYFFFQAGDGLYPWELWVNSWGKSNKILEVPQIKWNVLHPTPIAYYDNIGGDIDPSMLVEVLGFTKLNYSENGSFPIGGSFAVDFRNDKVRYGGVIHLPIKGVFDRLGLDPIADFIPCELCSIAFMTDNNNDWSIGLKIDVARLFYAPQKARKKYFGFFKK